MLPERSILEQKDAIRRDMLSRLKSQSPGDRNTKSLKIKELVLNSPFFRKAGTVMFYAATPSEVDTRPLIDECIKMGKRAALPVTDTSRKKLIPVGIDNMESLAKSSLGILEPAREEEKILSPGAFDLIVVPGIAFDKSGNRLGRGAGYYDRFLAGLPANTVKVGLAFDFQVIDDVPVVPGLDIRLDFVISG